MHEVSNAHTEGRPWFQELSPTDLASPTDLEGNKEIYYAAKRAIDLMLASLSLVMLLPLLLTIGIVIKLTSRGPALFVQQRVGAIRRKDGDISQWHVQHFSFYKFRSMYTDTDEKLHKQFVEAYISGDEDRLAKLQPDLKSATAYKLSGDPRVTGVGKFLRRTSLDELPQLINVIKGEMSLVGPRPPIPYEVKKYRPEHFGRLAATPGITGLWQVSGRTETTFEEMVQLDLEYIEKQSVWLDLKILLKTVPAVISERGAG